MSKKEVLDPAPRPEQVDDKRPKQMEDRKHRRGGCADSASPRECDFWERQVEQESRSNAHWRVLRRSLLLFALGLVYEGVSKSWPDSGVSESWPDIRLLGVLNRETAHIAVWSLVGPLFAVAEPCPQALLQVATRRRRG
jgi:hypothetical protein